MPNEDRTVWVVFNGEIYNFHPLRQELLQADHCFASHSDTEVLVHGYEQWGMEGMVRRLRGMFAFCIWDGPRRKVHLARDHLGKKPLFYSFQSGRLRFASDIKSLWLTSDRGLAINPKALDEFLYYYFIGQAHTIFEGIEKLPPASMATVDGKGVRVTRYWSPDYSRKDIRSLDEWLEGADHYLRKAVRRRLLSDVPLGAFLSGGIDSSCICALMATEGVSPLRTFTVGFDSSPNLDEREFARAVANHIGSDHTELCLAAENTDCLSDLVWQYGEPFGDSSALPSFLIARAARDFVTVVLTGDGGDETFAGYSRFLVADRARKWRHLPTLLRNGLPSLLAHSLLAMAPRRLLPHRADIFAKYLRGDPAAVAQNLCWWDGLRHELYSDTWRQRIDGWHPVVAQSDLLNSLSGNEAADRAMEYVLVSRLPSDYLTKVDVATMAHSLEARCPFLDVDLIEFATRIPVETLLANGESKSVLKRLAEKHIPWEVIHRPKRGFEIPIGAWLRGRWRKGVLGVLQSPTAEERGYFRPSVVRRVIHEHMAGRADHSHRIWTLLVWEVWHRLFVDRSLKPGDPVLEHTV